MMDKIRVKDLADDLKMQPKDLLAVIKELHIQARASNSVLADEEIMRIKDRIQQNSSAERREGTDVIVRRRRKAEAYDAPAAQAAEAENEAPEKPAAPEAPGQAEVPEPAPKAEPVKAVKKEPEKAAAAPKTARVIKPAPESTPARVVSRPAPKAEPESTPQAKATAVKGDDKRASQANLSAEPEKSADGSTVSSTPQFAESSQPDRPEQDNARQSPGVRVISRPSAEQQAARLAGGERSERRPAGTQPGGRPGYQRPGADGRSAPRGDGRSDGRPAGTQPGGRPDARGDRAPGRFAGQAPRPAPTPGPVPATQSESDRNKKRTKGKRTVDFSENKRFRGEGDEAWARSGSGRKNKGRKQKPELKQASQPIKAAKRKIRMEEFIRVADLAHQMGLKAGEIIKILFNLGVMATINQSLDIDTATLVAAEFNYEVERVGFSEDEFVTEQAEDDPDKLVTRPPVVTIMGHVDHGKTSLLDAIRKTSVTSGEAGGITQHIGAYHVRTKKGDIVFLDTPGHEAFTAMRARGAEVTDIVVLVVAADDGVMEQTREAINHSKAAGVPIMVAVNKMDKEEANPDRVKRELAELGMVPEEWGGDVTFSYVSAKTRDGLDDFLELLALQAEILELKANPDKPARGHIVEAKLDKGRGALGTVLIQQGTLRVGDSFVSGIHNGRVRAMFDDQGRKVTEAGPSMPVEVQGFDGVPEAGEEFIVIADEKTARRIAEARALKQRERELAKESKITLETFLSRRADAAEALVLNLVVKADVHGSLEAIQEQLKKLSGEKVRINIVHGGTGAISESDVLLAAASEAIIIGFNVRPNQKTKDLAEQEKVDIRFYDIIYKLTEEITSAMEGLLSPVEKEVSMGSAEVRETFSVPKVGTIAGCMVQDGKITRNAKVRLLRDGVVIHTGSISSLKRFKDDVKEVLKGYECGIGIENYNDIKVGDVIEGFEIVEEAAKL